MSEAPEYMKSQNVKYVSGKIKSLKWKLMNSVSEISDIFVSGTWDEEHSALSVWHMNHKSNEPTLLQEISHNYDINAIQYVTPDLLTVGFGDGSVKLYEHNESHHLTLKYSWDKCHKINLESVASTALASKGNQIVSVGEDGEIFLFNLNNPKPTKIINSDCDSSDYAVTFVTSTQILTGNLQGHLRLWDLRSKDHLKATLLSPDQVSVNHLCQHPTQQHLIASSMEDGTLALWDMRSTSQPFLLISAHSGSILQSEFHPSHTDHLFTCGSDGKVLHWDASASSRMRHTQHFSRPRKEAIDVDAKSSQTNAWLSDDIKQGCLDGVSLISTSMLPVNCLNINAETLLAGSDNECIYIVNNVLFE